MKREQFMNFFRNDEKLNSLSADDRIEIFKTILLGSSDITTKRLNDLINDYNVEDIKVVDRLWLDTHVEFSHRVLSEVESGLENEKINSIYKEQGMQGCYNFAEQLTDEFLAEYKAQKFDGDYADSMEIFYNEKLM